MRQGYSRAGRRTGVAPNDESRPRNEYVLTAKGKDLSSVLVMLHAWGNKHVYAHETAGFDMVHATCGHSLDPKIACGHCGEVVKRRDIKLTRADNCPTVGEVIPKEAAGEINDWVVDQVSPMLIAVVVSLS